jgi:hypothetical protein
MIWYQKIKFSLRCSNLIFKILICMSNLNLKSNVSIVLSQIQSYFN